MGIFSKLFGKSRHDYVRLLDESITKLRLAAFTRLEKYLAAHGKDTNFLAAGILNEALVEEPGNTDAQKYLEQNRQLIKSETRKLNQDPKLAEVLSYLYAAQTLYLAIVTHNPFSNRTQELGNKAIELSLNIASIYQICGSNDAQKCIVALSEISTRLYENADQYHTSTEIPHMTSAQDPVLIEAQIKRWTEDVRRNPSDFETLAAIAAGYGKLGHHTKAIEYFQKALFVNPSFAEAYLGMASSYGFLGRFNDKIEACKKAISLKPDYAEAYGNLGAALGTAGRHEESIHALKEAVRLKPDFADAHFALGLAYLSLGNRNLAVKQSQILDRLSPDLSKQLTDLIALN